MRTLNRRDVGISSIVAHELFFGAYRGERSAETVALSEELRFPILDFGRDDARAAGEIRAALTAAGTPIGPYDVLIAGQALTRGLTLVTRNRRAFGRVLGLNVEDREGEGA